MRKIVSILCILALITPLLPLSLFSLQVYATQNTYNGIQAANELDQFKRIPDSYPSYRVSGDDLFMLARFVYVKFDDLPTQLYMAVDIEKTADNGYILIHERDVESWIAYYGKYNTDEFITHIKTITPEIRVMVGGVPEIFYNHAKIATYAGGSPGEFYFRQLPNGNWVPRVSGVKQYDTDYKHYINMIAPVSVKTDEEVSFELQVRDGSIFFNQQQYWNLSVEGPDGHFDILHNHRVLPDVGTHEYQEKVKHVFYTPGEYTVVFKIEDGSYHNDYRTRTNRYSVTRKINVMPAEPQEPSDPLPPLNGPVADFNWTPDRPKAGNSVRLIDLSYHPDNVDIVGWEWKSEGHVISRQQNPSYVFPRPGTYPVTLTVTDANGLKDSITKYIPVDGSLIPPNACINAPKVISAGDFAYISSCSWDEDGEIVELDWNWTGKSMNNVGGTLEKDSESGVLQFFYPGEYAVQLRVTDNDGLTDWTEVIIDVIPPYPVAVITVEGTLKENRRVVLDANKSFGTPYYPVVPSMTTWEIKPLDGQDPSVIKVRGGSLTGHRKEVLFKEPGRYEVILTVYNTYGNKGQSMQILEIQEDVPPIARFTVTPTVAYRDPQDNHRARFTLRDLSLSLDDDYIQQRIWSYAFDSDNDGDYTDENWIIINDENKQIIEFIATHGVGDYYFSLEVVEGFGQETLHEFITPEDYRRAKD